MGISADRGRRSFGAMTRAASWKTRPCSNHQKMSDQIAAEIALKVKSEALVADAGPGREARITPRSVARPATEISIRAGFFPGGRARGGSASIVGRSP